MAIAAPVFLLVVAIIEFSTVFLATLTLQHAVHEGSRFAITGDSAASATGSRLRDETVVANARQRARHRRAQRHLAMPQLEARKTVTTVAKIRACERGLAAVELAD